MAGPVSVFRREALRCKVVTVAVDIRVRSGLLARKEAPLKGQEALAAANFKHLKQVASDLSFVRASMEAEHQANKAFRQELLSALVSFSFLLFISIR